MKCIKSRFPKLSSATNEFGQYIKAQPKYAIAAGKKKGLSNVSSSLITKLPPSKIIPEREPLGELIAKAKSKSLRTESYALDKIRNTYGVENDPTRMSYISVNQERIDKVANEIFKRKSNRLKKIDIAAEKRIAKIKSSSTFKGKKYDPSKAVLKIKKPVLGTNLYGPPVRTTGTVTSKFGKNVKSKIDILKEKAINLADKAKENTIKKMEIKLAIRQRRLGSKASFDPKQSVNPMREASAFKETKRSWGFSDDDFSPIQKQSYAKSKAREASFYSPLTGNPLSGAYQDPFTKQFVIRKKPSTFTSKQNVKEMYSKLKGLKKK